MARRKDHTREELTQLAIDAGREIVRTEGVKGLTARNVAKEIGYTPGTLYNLFDNIEGLICAINSRTLLDFAQTVKDILSESESTESGLRSVCLAYLDFYQREPALWLLLFATPIKSKTEGYLKAINQAFDQVTEAILPISKDETAARQDAKIIWSTLHGICLLQQTGKLDINQEDTPETLTNRYLDRFLAQN